MPLPRGDALPLVALAIFVAALLHTFAAGPIGRLGRRFPRFAIAFHLLGEVELVFVLWSAVLLAAIASLRGGEQALAYVASRRYTEPLFVAVVMLIAGSRPVLAAVTWAVDRAATALPLPPPLARAWLGLAAVPLLGSLITEPAAMTIAAALLAPLVFRPQMPEPVKYLALGALFVNVSIGGTLTAYAAPPVLMVASTWQWDSGFVFTHFGWKAALAVGVNATVVAWALREPLRRAAEPAAAAAGAVSTPAPASAAFGVPAPLVAVHLALLAGVVVFAHQPAWFLAVFVLFLGVVRATRRHQHPLIFRQALLVGLFLAALVVLGGWQTWWLQPIVAGLQPLALFFGALGLTALTDNAALTYLGSLIPGLSDAAKLMLVAGSVAGGGLTVIANAPNPAGAALLKDGFTNQAIAPGALLLGALGPTAVAVLAFLLA